MLSFLNTDSGNSAEKLRSSAPGNCVVAVLVFFIQIDMKICLASVNTAALSSTLGQESVRVLDSPKEDRKPNAWRARIRHT